QEPVRQELPAARLAPSDDFLAPGPAEPTAFWRGRRASFAIPLSPLDLGEPQVSDPKDPEEPLMQKPPGSPLVLPHTLQELLSKDTIQVQLIPEKKGLFLKHVEYEVSSKRFRCSVYRRYNDFVVFHEMLLQKFPYRMVPGLPPKRMLGADREFIETRRRALKRFINLVARHPPFSEDVLLKFFLSFSGSDVQNKLRELVQGEYLPTDIQIQFAASRELIRNIYNSFYKLRDRTERIASRAVDNASDLLLFGKELSALGSDTTPLPSWAALNHSAWGSLKQALKGLSVEFAMLADKAVQQGKQEENDVVEKLNLFLDLLQSYKVSPVFKVPTQLVHIYLPLTSHILGAFVNSQIQGHKEMSKVWNELKPKLSCLFAGSSEVLMLPLSAQEDNFLPS
ncbi:Sorting nexin-8, partial [Ophiophagus hannah]